MKHFCKKHDKPAKGSLQSHEQIEKVELLTVLKDLHEGFWFVLCSLCC